MKKNLAIPVLVAAFVLFPGLSHAANIPSSFASTSDDRAAIEQLLVNYSTAVSTKNQALFESLLLNKTISFSSAGAAIRAGAANGGAQNYSDFQKGVFQGPAFTQTFRDIHIEQDGPLASVSLVFVNSAPDGSSWGWKTMQLLKVNGGWKIASEFFTGHALG